MGGTSSKIEPFVGVGISESENDVAMPEKLVGATAWPFPSVDAARKAGKSEGEILDFLKDNNLQLVDPAPKETGTRGEASSANTATTTTTTTTKEILRFPGAGAETNDPPQLAGEMLDSSSRKSPGHTSRNGSTRLSITESPSVRRLMGNRKASSLSAFSDGSSVCVLVP